MSILSMMRKKISRKSATVIPAAFGSIVKPKPISPDTILAAASSAILENRTPQISPSRMLTPAVRIFSQIRIFTRLRFPIPRI